MRGVVARACERPPPASAAGPLRMLFIHVPNTRISSFAIFTGPCALVGGSASVGQFVLFLLRDEPDSKLLPMSDL